MALDADGSYYALSICPDDQPLDAARALESIPVVQMRMVRGAWQYLRDTRDGNLAPESPTQTESS